LATPTLIGNGKHHESTTNKPLTLLDLSYAMRIDYGERMGLPRCACIEGIVSIGALDAVTVTLWL